MTREWISAGGLSWSSAERAHRNTSQRQLVWLVIVLLSCCYFVLGHDWRRSTRMEDGFNIDAAEMETQMQQGSHLWRATFVTIGMLGTVLLLTPGGSRLRVEPVLATAILATLGWCALSLAWSQDGMLTLRRVVVLFCVAVGALGVARHFTATDLCLLATTFSATAIAVGLLAELSLGTFRPWEAEYRFAGTVHPNTQAIQLATVILGSIVLWRTGRVPRWLLSALLVVAVTLLLGTRSRTAVAACASGVFSIWLVGVSARAKLMTATCLILVLGTAGIALLSLGIDQPDRFAKVVLLGRDDDAGTLTGRLPIWQFVSQDIARHPWTGAGYNTYWTDEVMTDVLSEFGWPVPDAHNAYLETVLNIGLIGLALVLLSVLIGGWQATRRVVVLSDLGYAFVVGMLGFGAANACLESYMLIPFNFAPFPVACGLLRLAFWESGRPVADQGSV